MVYVFGLNVPLLELLVVFAIAVVIYLVLLEVQFRKVMRIVNRLDQEEKEIEEERKFLEKASSKLKGLTRKKRKKKRKKKA